MRTSRYARCVGFGALLAVAAPAAAQPAAAHAHPSGAACLESALEPALSEALSLELGVTLAPCSPADADREEVLRISIVEQSPVAPLDIEVTEGGRAVSGRTAHPSDVMGPRAIAVVVRSLVDELRAGSEESPTPLAPPQVSVASEPDRAPEPRDETVESPPRTPWLFGVTIGAGILIGWGDATVSERERDSRLNILTVGGEARVHHLSGHGATFSMRFAPSSEVTVLAIDARYSFRLGRPPGLDVLGGAMFFEVGLGVVRGYYSYTDLDGTTRAIVERVGVGPSVALVGVVHLGPVTLALDAVYTASVNPWGAQDAYGLSGHADEVTFGSDFELSARIGSHLPL